MDFTREPIIETVITPKEGFKLVVRSSKGIGQEEYFVDAVEVVAFGHAQFFRSQERPKSFLVPVNDYEILEVREARMILKNVGMDRSIKIGGGREAPMRSGRETEKVETENNQPHSEAGVEGSEAVPAAADGQRTDKKRDRRTRHRRRRGRDDAKEGASTDEEGSKGDEKIDLPEPRRNGEAPASGDGVSVQVSTITALLPPPPTLISETIARYRQDKAFEGAFYTKEEAANKEKAKEEGEGSRTFRSEEDSGYPSLDVIDEAIDKPQIPQSSFSETNVNEAVETGSSSLEKDDLWDFSEEVKKEDET